ncbi:hypothetical protein A2U01_0081552, partial [Trifolium medium]|nr:hypothetical protein [Trifolium medium]
NLTAAAGTTTACRTNAVTAKMKAGVKWKWVGL